MVGTAMGTSNGRASTVGAHAIGTLLALLAFTGPTAAVEWPSRPLTLVVPFAAGGPSDVLSRTIGERMHATLSQTVVIENVTGAAGTIGVTRAARSPADGYTISMGHLGTHVVNGAMYNLPFDLANDFEPLALLASNPMMIVSKNAVPAKNLKELIAYVKANPGKLSYGSAGAGTMTQLAGELFKQMIGAPEITHVPYRGAGPSITDLVAGQIPMATINLTGQTVELHRTGKIRILAVTAPERLKGVPEIPTAIEEGMPGMVAQLFMGLFLPARTPRAIVDQVYEATQKTMSDPAMQNALLDQGLEPITNSSPDKVRAFIEEEVARWTPVVQAAGLKAG